MKSFNAFVLAFGLTAVLTFFGACSKENVSDASKVTEVDDLKAQIEDLRNQVQVLEGTELTGKEVVEPDKESKIKSQKERADALVQGIVSSVRQKISNNFVNSPAWAWGKRPSRPSWFSPETGKSCESGIQLRMILFWDSRIK